VSSLPRCRIGIMQGRLSPRPAERIQAFPHATWEREFSLGAEIGCDAIEWIFEAPRHAENPIASGAGRQRIREVIAANGVPIRSVCADYFLVRRLAGPSERPRRENIEVLRRLIEQAAEIGARRILLPLLEEAAPLQPALADELTEALLECVQVAAACGIQLGLEMELPGTEYRAFVERAAHSCVRAYYDTGNSTAQGFDIATDVVPLMSVLGAVHVKDRLVGGSTRPLGEGAANFPGFFATLAGARFDGDFVLQHYFDARPVEQARQSLAFVRAEWQRAWGRAA
jgi:hexulose-6-phosphate isomerase